MVVGTLLLHGLTLPWLIQVLDISGDDDATRDALAIVAAQTKAADAAANRLDELLARRAARGQTDGRLRTRGARCCAAGTSSRSNAAWEEQLGRGDDELGEAPARGIRRLRLEMLKAERETFIAERDADRIDDEVLRSLLRDLDLEEATLNR